MILGKRPNAEGGEKLIFIAEIINDTSKSLRCAQHEQDSIGSLRAISHEVGGQLGLIVEKPLEAFVETRKFLDNLSNSTNFR